MPRPPRAAVWERCEGRSDLSGLPLPREAWELHHRRPGRQGGTALPDQQSPANCVALLPYEHNMHPRSVHMAPVWAKRLGFLLPSGQGVASVPHLVPVWWRGTAWAYLTAEGLVVAVPGSPRRPGGQSGRGPVLDAGDEQSGRRAPR